MVSRLTIRFLAIACFSTAAHGAVVILVTESGGDVVATGSGSLNTTALFLRADLGVATGTNPTFGYMGLGTGIGKYYETISGPEGFGAGSAILANQGMGDKFGIGDRGTWLLVPENYISGSPLFGSATWTGTTIAGMGMTPGSYTWNWGSGAATDSLTLHIGVVPEISSIMLLGFGSAGLLAFYRKKPATPDEVAG